MRVAGAVCGRSRVRSSTPRCSSPVGRWRRRGPTRRSLLDEVAVDDVRAGAARRVGRRPRGARHGGRRAPERERRGRHPTAPGGGVGGLPGPWRTARRRRSGRAGTRRGARGLRRARRRRPVVGRAGRRRGPRRAGAHAVATPGSGERGRVRTDRRGAGGAAGTRGGRGVARDGRGPRLGRVDQRARARRPGPDGGGPRSGHDGRGRPGRPAASRRDVLVPVRRRRGAGPRARPARVRGGVRVGVHGLHAGAQPRARGDGCPDPRKRAGDAAVGGRGSRWAMRRGRPASGRSVPSSPDAVATVRAQLGTDRL